MFGCQCLKLGSNKSWHCVWKPVNAYISNSHPFDPQPKLGQWLCLETPGARNKDRRKMKNVNQCNKCDFLMI